MTQGQHEIRSRSGSSRAYADWPSTTRARADSAGVSASALAALIEGRLADRMRNAAHASPSVAVAPDSAALDAFVRAVLSEDIGAIERRIESMRRAGNSLPTIFLQWLAPTARRLGVWWEEDRIGCTDVTLALGKLHQVLHRSVGEALRHASPPPPAGHALFATLPGEQHRFGLAMVDETFRLAGWQTVIEPDLTAARAVSLVRDQFFDIIGISAASAATFPALSTLIENIRAASCNRDLLVLVGGPVFLEDPAAFVSVGADAMAVSAQQALELAKQKFGFGACANTSRGSK